MGQRAGRRREECVLWDAKQRATPCMLERSMAHAVRRDGRKGMSNSGSGTPGRLRAAPAGARHDHGNGRGVHVEDENKAGAHAQPHHRSSEQKKKKNKKKKERKEEEEREKKQEECTEQLQSNNLVTRMCGAEVRGRCPMAVQRRRQATFCSPPRGPSAFLCPSPCAKPIDAHGQDGDGDSNPDAHPLQPSYCYCYCCLSPSRSPRCTCTCTCRRPCPTKATSTRLRAGGCPPNRVAAPN